MNTLLQVNELHKHYGVQKIFEHLSFSVTTKQKIAIIGRNGAGKTTLIRIILGLEKADDGQVLINSETHLGYINQTNDWLNDETSLAYLIRTSGTPEWTAKKQASKFAFTESRLAQLVSKLSGGWQMRLKIISALLKEPNLFILDEPSNYLDLHTLILLEKYLKNYQGSCLIVSHDREFLKSLCNSTLEISPHSCYHYPGGLEEYLAFKEQKQTSLLKLNAGLEQQQEHLQEFVDHFRAKASKAKQAQAALRKIQKLETKRITIEHQAGLTRIVMPSIIKRKNMALRVKRLSIGYKKPLVNEIDFDLSFGERLAVLGLNGQGKTTLLKTLAGHLEPLSGSYHWFSGGRLAYYSQDSSELLKGQQAVGDYLRTAASADIKTETVLKMAGDFLFNSEALKKPIGVLSGGEKSRLMLAGLLLSKPDMLLMDEPNSHLDFETVEALATALGKFNGALLFTSHDRTFTNLLATSLLEISDGQAVRRWQDYEQYIEELSEQLHISEVTPQSENSKNGSQHYLEQKNHQKKLAAAEKELARLNKTHAELMWYFNDHPLNYAHEKVKELDQLNKAIKQAEDRWLEFYT
ncbi:hypothetical protein COT94_01140 [Candidatus Falkowbacteria bacterium CG10_big_fil_rev_8_21_14_0_10_37_14]|uniref:ABC transporter domain-containing protein n=1 Tax=Candidatus Falkowbacteria bacterium CG10_big_fil_rev_8_21_14_0_10_37_14 TaxID=1974561 RepID=A0A2M6WU14_9BACT|nr:ABC-F family ATP-binding cassette domain-containing protein [Candidatus Falkowbacteria bacterium]PIT96279.1 MAG: hypothetical protein COT94_01140 [Candidatus Falkowbacteria bacterium CG10_big_fil_rev_8_21_14_0_10_37_14]